MIQFDEHIFQMGWNNQLDDFHVTHENRFEWILCLKEWKWNAKTGSFMLLHTGTLENYEFSSIFLWRISLFSWQTRKRDQSRTN